MYTRYTIQCMDAISQAGLSCFPPEYQVTKEAPQPHAILLRSSSLHAAVFPESLCAIARAGAGVNNIPLERCSQNGIAVFNTPGANANAVKELVLAGFFLSSRKIFPAVEWVKSLQGKGEDISRLVEKGKGNFSGPEIRGKALGVIGLGTIGIQVANGAHALGMTVYGYDPYLSVDAAWGLSRSVQHARTLEEIFSLCDYITLHVPLSPETRNFLSRENLQKMKPGVRILNFARGELADPQGIKEALQSGTVAAYITDFPQEEHLDVPGAISIPHLGASTPESEENCARMAVKELTEYLETGNVENSVNFPPVSMPREGTRICIAHRNLPNTISRFSGIAAENGINIENMASKSRGDYAYTLLDITGSVTSSTVQAIGQLKEVTRIRVLP